MMGFLSFWVTIVDDVLGACGNVGVIVVVGVVVVGVVVGGVVVVGVVGVVVEVVVGVVVEVVVVGGGKTGRSS